MNLLFRLSARHLRVNKKRTTLTVLGIALAVAMVTAISGFIVSFQDLLYQDSVLREGLWHAEYQNVDDETAAKIGAEDAVKEVAFLETEEGRVLRVLFEKEDRLLLDRSEEIAIRYGVAQEDRSEEHTSELQSPK
jgi:ABC-type antimicrobial peptide transport system permease subunit